MLQIVGPLWVIVPIGSCLYRLHAWPSAQGTAYGPFSCHTGPRPIKTTTVYFHQYFSPNLKYDYFRDFLCVEILKRRDIEEKRRDRERYAVLKGTTNLGEHASDSINPFAIP